MIRLPPPDTLMRDIVDFLAQQSASRADISDWTGAYQPYLSKPLLRLVERGIISTDGQRPATYSLTPACLLALGNGEARAA
jgi:DNA-binding IclR family transcriptional regulator